MAECCAVQMRLAAANFGAAIGLNMHLFTVGIIYEHVRRARDLTWVLLEAIASQKRMVASAFAEPGLAGSILRANTTGVRVDGGYKVTGVKVPCSLAARCDLVCFQFMADEDRPDPYMVALVPSNAEGISVAPTWNPMGMKASESDTMRFDGCFVPDELIFYRGPAGIDPDNTFSAGLTWFCLLTTAAYTGAAKSALQTASAAMLKGSIAGGLKRADSPAMKSMLGELHASVLVLESACAGIAQRIDAGAAAEDCLNAAMALKHQSVEVCTRAAAGAMELSGAASYADGSKLAALLKDMQGVHFHPPTRFVIRTDLGRALLGRPITFDLVDPPAADKPPPDNLPPTSPQAHPATS